MLEQAASIVKIFRNRVSGGGLYCNRDGKVCSMHRATTINEYGHHAHGSNTSESMCLVTCCQPAHSGYSKGIHRRDGTGIGTRMEYALHHVSMPQACVASGTPRRSGV